MASPFPGQHDFNNLVLFPGMTSSHYPKPSNGNWRQYEKLNKECWYAIKNEIPVGVTTELVAFSFQGVTVFKDEDQESKAPRPHDGFGDKVRQSH